MNKYNEWQDARYSQLAEDLQQYREHNPSIGRDHLHPCLYVWDCRAMGYDLASLGLSVAGDALIACRPASGGLCAVPAGAVKNADAVLTLESLRYATAQHALGNASDLDLAVSYATNGVSIYPGVGVVAPLVSLGWNLVDPLVPDESWGSVGRAR